MANGGSGPRAKDPPFAGAFVLEVDGLEIGRFTEVTGLSVTMQVEEVVEGGNNESTVKLPGRLVWPNLVLKRGITADNLMLEWILSCAGEGLAGKGGRVARRPVSLSLLDSMFSPVRRWEVRDALPVRWTGPQFAVGNAAVATEELEVCHAGFQTA